jgi:hypothetical protein
MMELVWTSIGAIVLLFCIAWLVGAVALAWWFHKNREKSWEDGIDWEDGEYFVYKNYVVIKAKEAA